MAKVTYDKKITALLVIDPYNDFLSEGGKLWDRVKGVAEALIGLDHGETVTTPSLPDMAVLGSLRSGPVAPATNLSRSSPAERYGVAALNATGGR